MISHRQRLEVVLSGEKPDRTPIALWRHFPVDDRSAAGLAAATLAYQCTFDFDLVKVTPQSAYSIEDWGGRSEWRGAPEGTYTYAQRVVSSPEDWLRLPVLDPTRGRLRMQLECLNLIVNATGPDTPVLQTIFNPLSQAKNLAGEATLLNHLRRYPEAVHAGLTVIAESTRRFIEACLATGIAGVFYAVQHAQYGLLSEAEYTEFGARYDLPMLEPAGSLWLNMLHLHGQEVMFDLLAGYPVQVINWHDRESGPDLPAGLARFPGVVCGGLRRDATLLLGTPDQVQAEARQAIESVDGQRLILGAGCVAFTTVPYGNLMAARQAVETGA